MVSHSEPVDQRIKELLAGRVLGDLAQMEEDELNRLGASTQIKQLEFELEQTAAAVQIAFLSGSDVEPMPMELKQRIINTAKIPSKSENLAPKVVGNNPVWNVRELVAWAACAACLILAAMTWRSKNVEDGNAPKPVPTLYAREEFIRNTKDKLTVKWSPGKHPFADEVSGDVIWSNEQQQGFMRFVGMPINDPRVEQYQLWIIDPQRDDEPIDGGVFDITSSGEAIVPIQAKLKVVQPAAFAITIEKPGGVVVSKQERLPLLAAVGQ